jgi:hypothetical protein
MSNTPLSPPSDGHTIPRDDQGPRPRQLGELRRTDQFMRGKPITVKSARSLQDANPPLGFNDPRLSGKR